MSDSKPPMVYQANPITGEYSGQYYADPDPLDEGNWLIPGMAFTEAPPTAKMGFAAVHVPGKKETWTLLEDVRGTVYRTDTGEPVVWDKFGALPDGLTSVPQPSLYHAWVDGSWKLDTMAEGEAQRLQALKTRDGLLREAAVRIAPLQDAVDLGGASVDEEVELKSWKQYRVALNRVQLQPNFPASVNWPAVPNSPLNSGV